MLVSDHTSRATRGYEQAPLSVRWNMKSVVSVVLLVFSGTIWAECPPWKPDIKFELEGTDELNTLAWLGGWAFAVTEATKAGDLNFAVPECGYLISRELVGILNEKHEGETISAEDAAAYIWPKLKMRLSKSSSLSEHPSADSPTN